MGKLLTIICVTAMMSISVIAEARVKYINGYTRINGTYVGGHYRDTSNNGCEWDNANSLGYNY